MSVVLEYRKIKRSGLRPAFLGGGILAALVPILNMAVRSENFLTLEGEPLQILIEANWDVMAMLNILLAVAGACILYHIEYEERGFQRMNTLPIASGSLILGKFVVLVIGEGSMLLLEFLSLGWCVEYWFGHTGHLLTQLIRNAGWMMTMMLPVAAGMLVIASLFQNMWVSLGIGVLCVFVSLSFLPLKSTAFSVFPFALPFQTFDAGGHMPLYWYVSAAAIETVILGITGWMTEHVKERGA